MAKVGDEIRLADGTFGTILAIEWRGGAGREFEMAYVGGNRWGFLTEIVEDEPAEPWT